MSTASTIAPTWDRKEVSQDRGSKDRVAEARTDSGVNSAI
jgi:hypothetical protein